MGPNPRPAPCASGRRAAGRSRPPRLAPHAESKTVPPAAPLPQVLAVLPSALRRRVLGHMYSGVLEDSWLLEGWATVTGDACFSFLRDLGNQSRHFRSVARVSPICICRLHTRSPPPPFRCHQKFLDAFLGAAKMEHVMPKVSEKSRIRVLGASEYSHAMLCEWVRCDNRT